MNRLTATGMLLVAFSLVACGDDGDPGGSATDALGDKQGKDLTAEEMKSICEEGLATHELSKEDSCEITGVIFSGLGGQTCDQAKAECLSKPEQVPTSDCGQQDPATFADCTATVNELKACSDAQFDALEALTCASTMADITTFPAVCNDVKQKCPGAFKPDSGSSAP